MRKARKCEKPTYAKASVGRHEEAKLKKVGSVQTFIGTI